jgi:protein-S-isoprenylcysteine O-methyltransferase Ste14
VIERVVAGLVRVSRIERTTTQRIVILSGGILLFLVGLPWLLMIIGGLLAPRIAPTWPRTLELALAAPLVLLGLLMIGWATVTQWWLGKGTPAPLAPPQHLIVRGAYRLCRNPIQLGLLFYMLGVITWLDTFTTALAGVALWFVPMSAYHKFIEERELLERFGAEYREYRDRTPFLIPRVGRRSRRAS